MSFGIESCLPCGTAMPRPMPVVACASRSWMAFRAVVRSAMNKGMTAEQIDGDFISEIAGETFGRAVSLSSESVARAVDPRQAIEARQGSGGPSAHDMGELLASLEASCDHDRGAFDKETAALDNAEADLNQAFRKLAATG